jgi:hypothetical protein
MACIFFYFKDIDWFRFTKMFKFGFEISFQIILQVRCLSLGLKFNI